MISTHFLLQAVLFLVGIAGAAAAGAAAVAASPCSTGRRRTRPLLPTTLSGRMPGRGGGGGGGGCGAAVAASTATTSKSRVEMQEGIGPMEIFLDTIREARRHLAAAAVARSVSIFGMYPMDTIKTRMQMEQPNPLKLEGMYKGVGGSLFGQVPYGVLTFGSYEIYKKSLLERFPNVRPALIYAMSAILGDVTGSGWLCPSEVVKQQMQAGMYPSTSSAIRGIWNKRGIAGFYQGYLGGLARDVPFRVSQLTSYEVTKNLYLRVKGRRLRRAAEAEAEAEAGAGTSGRRGKKQKKKAATATSTAPGEEKLELSPVDAALCGAIAGSFSAAITSPLDRIKTLLMTDSAAYGTSVLSCAAKIWRDEGMAGFCAGMVPRVTYIAPSVAIFFIAYEQVQQRLLPSGAGKSK